ncbi:polypeptide N-acetylgalactosaminyltransferase 35A [Diorhabda sublineata]|uniref:polypeptide N-acetylgalactosaminyltransferase 35A n=1 Tax=Diorhabda sublineata TaxID=1163346 RepID=UPI0024E0B095|nr:polypeptide N-acetylgalactosaminyltransferase 35A [Diorhabda sublineata]
MVSLNKSFLYGICFASATWLISLYLYFQLSKNENFSTTIKTSNLNNVAVEKITSSANILFKKIESTENNGDTNKDLSEIGIITSPKDQIIKDEGYKIHAYNVLISNRLGLNRSIPDTRNSLCKTQSFPNNLPSASIIICFYNEHYRTLLRSVQSILDRTPDNLLKEIILINDESDIENLYSDLVTYFKKQEFKKVKLFKTDRREGLIRARMFGSRKAEGEVLIFLDSHIEVNVGWIEPLLYRIHEKRTNVVMPIIDIINADTFNYSGSPLVRGGFNWGLHFKWENLPTGTLQSKEDFIKPIKSPTMAGGLFAIDKNYFLDIGEYDAGMDIWGGENLEISFRIWMCGGSLELIPCSRVGHIFRHRRPYGSPDGQDTMLRNSLRVANVWMDSYKDFFLKQRSDAKNVNYGDISSRLQLRKELKCFDFDWYLKNVYPELPLPSEDGERLKKKWSALEKDVYQPWHIRKRNYIDQFEIRLHNTSLCVQSGRDYKTKGSHLILRKCSKTKSQIWYETDKNELVLAQLLCLQYGKTSPVLYKCHEMGGDQEWKHNGGKETPIYNLAAGTCLAAEENKINATITMKICFNNNFATWDLVTI